MFNADEFAGGGKKFEAKVFNILARKYNLSIKEQCAILGMTEPLFLATIKNKSEFPAAKLYLRRLGHLMQIHSYLKKLYPDSPRLRRNWFHVAKVELGGKSPLQWVLAVPFELDSRLITVKHQLAVQIEMG